LKACNRFIDQILDHQISAPFWDNFLPLARHIALQGMKMSLVQTALKLTSPGVPDFYQGTELWDFSLVDPDNRRPVNYEQRREFLQDLSHSTFTELFQSWKDGRIKMRLIHSLLQHRRKHPSLFSQGSYTPLKITGPQSEHFLSFLRQDDSDQLLVVALRRMDAGGMTDLAEICKNTILHVPETPSAWIDIFTGKKTIIHSLEIPLETLFNVLPVSVFKNGF